MQKTKGKGTAIKSTGNAGQAEIVFKPRYSWRIRAAVYLFPAGVAACIFFVVMAILARSIFPYGIYAIIFGFLVFSTPMIIFREVRFGKAIILKRYFLPTRIIPYEDVSGFTLRGLVGRHGGISLANLQNREEFEKIIKKLVAQHKIMLKK
jgi:hypothetical protein